ncbi:hypothetical protein ABIC03_001637 [Bradyrhizobium sp. RT6a]
MTAPAVIPFGEIQETTPGERFGFLRHTPDPLGQTSVELLLHDTPLNITARSCVLCGHEVKKAGNSVNPTKFLSASLRSRSRLN